MFPMYLQQSLRAISCFFSVTWRLHFWVSLRALCLRHFWHSNSQSHVLDCWFFVAPWWHFNMKEEGFTWCRPGHILYVDDMNLDLLQHIDNVRSIMHMPMHIACTFENIDAPWSIFLKDECHATECPKKHPLHWCVPRWSPVAPWCDGYATKHQHFVHSGKAWQDSHSGHYSNGQGQGGIVRIVVLVQSFCFLFFQWEEMQIVAFHCNVYCIDIYRYVTFV